MLASCNKDEGGKSVFQPQERVNCGESCFPSSNPLLTAIARKRSKGGKVSAVESQAHQRQEQETQEWQLQQQQMMRLRESREHELETMQGDQVLHSEHRTNTRRPFCSVCKRPQRVCICTAVAAVGGPFSLLDAFAGILEAVVVYVHPLEAKRKMRSLTLLQQLMHPVHVFVCRRPRPVDQLLPLQHPRNLLLLFPTSHSAPVRVFAYQETCAGVVASVAPTVGPTDAPGLSAANDVDQGSGSRCPTPAAAESGDAATPEFFHFRVFPGVPGRYANNAGFQDGPATAGNTDCVLDPVALTAAVSDTSATSLHIAPAAAGATSHTPAVRRSCPTDRAVTSKSLPTAVPSRAAPWDSGTKRACDLSGASPAPATSLPVQLPLTLICLDGTWKECKEMFNSVQWLQHLPAAHLVFPPGPCSTKDQQPQESPQQQGSVRYLQQHNLMGLQGCASHAQGTSRSQGDVNHSERLFSGQGQQQLLQETHTGKTQSHPEADGGVVVPRKNSYLTAEREESTRKQHVDGKQLPSSHRGDNHKQPNQSQPHGFTQLLEDSAIQEELGEPWVGRIQQEVTPGNDCVGVFRSVRCPPAAIASAGGVCTAEAICHMMAAIARNSRSSNVSALRCGDNICRLLKFVAHQQFWCRHNNDRQLAQQVARDKSLTVDDSTGNGSRI